MLSPGFADALHRSALARRASRRSDGQFAYRPVGGEDHVLVTPSQWQAATSEFAARLKPVKRGTMWLSIALFPGILLYGMKVGQVLPFTGLIVLVAMFGGPLTIYLLHSRAVQAIATDLDRRLATGPACPAPPRDVKREPRWFEIAFLVLVGPGLLLSIIGEIGGPDTFRGTPLWGSGLGPLEWVALALIGVRLLWPFAAPRVERLVKRRRHDTARRKTSSQ